jgi:hypothetical protein
MPEGRAVTPEQKKEVCDRLYQAWISAPELRLFQLVKNACSFSIHHFDKYYVEDLPLIEAIESYIKEFTEP